MIETFGDWEIEYTKDEIFIDHESHDDGVLVTDMNKSYKKWRQAYLKLMWWFHTHRGEEHIFDMMMYVMEIMTSILDVDIIHKLGNLKELGYYDE